MTPRPALIGLAALAVGGSTPAAPPAKPNVVFIVADDLGYPRPCAAFRPTR